MGGAALFFGKEAPTNNSAEMSALRELLTWIADNQLDLGDIKQVVIFGDSELTINFMLRQARVSQNHLVKIYKQIVQLRK